MRYGAGDYAPAQGENELPRRRLMLFQPVPAGQFVFLPPSTIHFMSKKIFVKVRKGRSKNAAGDAFFDLPFLFPLTKNELQGQFFLLLTKKDRAKGGQKEKARYSRSNSSTGQRGERNEAPHHYYTSPERKCQL